MSVPDPIRPDGVVGLLERETELTALAAALDRARQGRGSVVVILGGAGLGKSSLIRAFRATLPDDVGVLSGSAENLVTARAFGPFREMFPAERGLDDRDHVVDHLVGTAHRRPPLVIVVDDIHWADEATLGVVRDLSGRLSDLPIVVVLAVRRDELSADHPVLRLLGSLTGPHVVRLELSGLSTGAVRHLAAAAGRDPEQLTDLEGNPFLVTEMLAVPPGMVPASVRDAIVGRLGTLPDREREVLQVMAVIPGLVEIDLLDVLVADAISLLERSERMDLVSFTGSRVGFRHDITRRAVESTLTTGRRIVLNRHVLEVLEKGNPDPSVLLHHAVGAADRAAIARHAPETARRAAQAHAHSEAWAASHFGLNHRDHLDQRTTAELHGIAARAAYALNRHDAAADHARYAVDIWQRIDPDAKETGQALITSARMQIMLGDPAASERQALEARNVLARRDASAALAEAYEMLANVTAVSGDNADAIMHSYAAIATARRVGAPTIEARAGLHLGLALAGSGDPEALAVLERTVDELAIADEPEYAARAASALAVVLTWQGRHPEALPHLDRAEEVARNHGLDLMRFHCASVRANVQIFQGHWDVAESTLRHLLNDDRGAALRVLPMAYLGGILLRRGDPEADPLIDEAYRLAVASGQIRRIGPSGAAMLERAWLAGEHDAAQSLARYLLDIAERGHLAQLRGKVLRCLRRCGVPVTSFDRCPDGYAAGIAGDWEAAAAIWQSVGNPYERALELVESPDPDTVAHGVRILDSLGARGTADVTRAMLRQRGFVRIPRQRTTGRALDRLTPRQSQIVDLIAQGLQSPEIASRLHLSRRTVDNHVAGILAALDVRSRREAVAVVRRARGDDPRPDTVVALGE